MSAFGMESRTSLKVKELKIWELVAAIAYFIYA